MSRAKIDPQEITQLLVGFKLFTDSGISRHDALSVLLEDQPNPHVRVLLKQIQERMSSGAALSAVMAEYPQYFEPFVTGLLRQAEADGNDAEMLARIIRYRDSRDMGETDIGAQLRNAWLYFGVMLGVFALIFTLLVMVVIPVFAEMFAGFGSELPVLTRIALSLSNFISTNVWLLIPLVVAIIAAFLTARRFRSALMRYTPGIGGSYRMLLNVRFLRSAVFCLHQEMSLKQAVENSAQAVNDPWYAGRLQKAAAIMEESGGHKNVLRPYIPARVLKALELGLQTPQLCSLLEKLADVYSLRVRRSLELNSKLLSGGLSLIIGALVFFLVIAMYLPIFKMGQMI